MKKILVCAVLTFFALGYCHGGYVGDNRVLKAQSNNTGGDKLNLADTSADDVISYYNGVDGLKGDNLKEELNSIISSDIYTISDSKVWDWMKITDRDWSIGSAVDPDSYTFSSDNNYFFYNLYASYNGDASRAVNRGMNSSGNTLVDREHCWPKSLGFKLSSTSSFVKPAGTDLHHLMASDHNNNNKHSNYAYGEVDTSKSYDSVEDKDSQGNSEPTGLLGYSKLWNNSDAKVYEPADEYKGDVARACLYMATRYQEPRGTRSAYKPNLTLVDSTKNIEADSDGNKGIGYYGELTTLLKWNESDPVDSYEIHRNNLIYNNVQKNRNPYIDHPEWARIVYDSSYTGSGASDDAPYVPNESGGGDDPDPGDVKEISSSTEVTYTIKNYLCQSGQPDQIIGDTDVKKTLVGNQVSANVLDSSNGRFGAMIVNGQYKRGRKVGANKMALSATDTLVENYYTDADDSLIVVTDQNDKVITHLAVPNRTTIGQDNIDRWGDPLIPKGYYFDGWYINNTKVTSATIIQSDTVVKAKISYDSDNSIYQVQLIGEEALLEDSSGNSGTELNINFDKEVTAVSDSPNFSYWKIGNRIVSYEREYSFSVYADIVIEEVKEGSISAVPTINLYHNDYNAGMNNYFICGYDVPNNYTLIETGVIFGGETYVQANEKVIANKVTNNNEYAVIYNGADAIKCAAYLVYMDGDEVKVIYDNGYGYEQLYFADITSCTNDVLNGICTYSRGNIVLAKNDKLYHDSSFNGIKFGSSNSSYFGELTINLPEGMTANMIKVHAKQYNSSENTLYVNGASHTIGNLTEQLVLRSIAFPSSNVIKITTPNGRRAFVDFIEIFYDK